MTIGEKLLDCRKKSHLSQEEVAEKLFVTRQTISKWETDQSTPDFDKIVPICELFQITTDELLTGKTKEIEPTIDREKMKKRSAFFLSISVFLYFFGLVWAVISDELFSFPDGVSGAGFLLFCGLGTMLLVYYFSTREKKEEPEERKNLRTTEHIVISIVACIFVISYFVVSFKTMAWQYTWILWLVFALVCEVVHLIFHLGGKK